MAAWVAPVVSAVAPSLIGAIFGRKKKERTTTDFTALRNEALKAGFNPAFALSATGGAGFQQTQHPGLSSLDFLGQALGAGVQAYLRHDPTALATKELENRLLAAEVGLAERQLGDLVAPRSAPRPFAKGDGTAITPLGGHRGIRIQDAADLGKPQPFERGMPALVSNPHLDMEVDPSVADAETYETRYGDVGTVVFGARNLLSDYMYGYRETHQAHRDREARENERQRKIPLMERIFPGWGADPAPLPHMRRMYPR